MFSSLVVLPVIAFVATILITRKSEVKKEGDVGVGNLGDAITAAGVTLLLALVGGCLVANKTPRASVITEFDKGRIVALSASVTTEGSFFLGSGQIEGRPCYFFYFETPDGGKKLDKLDASQVTLYEEDRKDAYFAKAINKRDWSGHGWVYDFFVPPILRSQEWGNEYAIHVPKGSIKEEIRLDLPK
jgi:hypothetical protein